MPGSLVRFHRRITRRLAVLIARLLTPPSGDVNWSVTMAVGTRRYVLPTPEEISRLDVIFESLNIYGKENMFRVKYLFGGDVIDEDIIDEMPRPEQLRIVDGEKYKSVSTSTVDGDPENIEVALILA